MGTAILGLNLTETKVLDAIQSDKKARLFLVSIIPLKLIYLLLKPPFLS